MMSLCGQFGTARGLGFAASSPSPEQVVCASSAALATTNPSGFVFFFTGIPVFLGFPLWGSFGVPLVAHSSEDSAVSSSAHGVPLGVPPLGFLWGSFSGRTLPVGAARQRNTGVSNRLTLGCASLSPARASSASRARM